MYIKHSTKTILLFMSVTPPVYLHNIIYYNDNDYTLLPKTESDSPGRYRFCYYNEDSSYMCWSL